MYHAARLQRQEPVHVCLTSWNQAVFFAVLRSEHQQKRETVPEMTDELAQPRDKGMVTELSPTSNVRANVRPDSSLPLSSHLTTWH